MALTIDPAAPLEKAPEPPSNPLAVKGAAAHADDKIGPPTPVQVGPRVTDPKVALRPAEEQSTTSEVFYTQHPGAIPPRLGVNPISEIERNRRDTVRADQLEKNVRFLADPGLAGRPTGSDGNSSVRKHLITQLKEMGLQPGFDDSFEQHVTDREGNHIATNVGGWILASEPNPQQEFVVLMAHHDHLVARENTIFPGADDNASSVAALLEVARVIQSSSVEKKRDLLILFPDKEEYGAPGSKYFLDTLQRPRSALKLAVAFELLANESIPGHVLVMGAETSRQTAALVQQTSAEPGAKPLAFSTPLVGDRSDYIWFRDANLPFMFITSGMHGRYHTPEDTADSLDYKKLAAVTRYIVGIALNVVQTTGAVAANGKIVDPQADLTALHAVADLFLQHPSLPDVLKNQLSELKRQLLFLLDHLKRRGELSSEQYSTIVILAQQLQRTLAATR